MRRAEPVAVTLEKLFEDAPLLSALPSYFPSQLSGFLSLAKTMPVAMCAGQLLLPVTKYLRRAFCFPFALCFETGSHFCSPCCPGTDCVAQAALALVTIPLPQTDKQIYGGKATKFGLCFQKLWSTLVPLWYPAEYLVKVT